MNAWFRCRDGMGHVTWPDGGSYLDQPLKLIAAFDVIARENAFWDKRTKDER